MPKTMWVWEFSEQLIFRKCASLLLALQKVTLKKTGEGFFTFPGHFLLCLRLCQSSRLLIIRFLILRTTEVSPASVFCIMNSMVMPAAGSLAK